MKYRYIIGVGSPRRLKYLKTRETNLKRACKTLRDILKGNTRDTFGRVSKVYLEEDGIAEKPYMEDKYDAQVKRVNGETYLSSNGGEFRWLKNLHNRK